MITLIDAGPGTGKTRILTMGYLLLSKRLYTRPSQTPEQEEIYDYLLSTFQTDSICFFTHSNSSKENIITRLGRKPTIYTFHGAGMSAVIKRYGYQKPEFNRTERHIETLIGRPLTALPYPEKRGWYAIKRILHYLKTEALLPTEESLEYLILKYPDLSSYIIPDDWQADTEELLNQAMQNDHTLDFSDMLALGKRSIQRPRFSIGLVDESQDVSRAAYQLVTRMCEHVIFCGDKNQAINAFAGASEEMYNSIAGKSDLIFPMKLTQRCPLHICDIANTVRPGGIVHGPNNLEGVSQKIDRDSLPEMLPPPLLDNEKPSCLFICRTNAGIISHALFMHRNHLPFSILNTELYEEITKFVKSFKTTSLATLSDKLSVQQKKVDNNSNKRYAQMMLDKILPVKEMISNVKSYQSLLILIERTFTPIKGGYIGTTIHGAKGMEAPNVFIINPPIELHSCMDHPIAKEQEINLHFVAVSRSSQNLYWVT